MLDGSISESFGFIPVESSEPVKSPLSHMFYLQGPTGSKLSAFDSENTLFELSPGICGEDMHVVETASKPVGVFSLETRPGLVVISLITTTTVLEIENGVISELDQSQTRISLSESTIYCGDSSSGVCVQAAKSWVNFFSKTGNIVYKCASSERIVACSSKLGHREVLVALGEGELRRRGRIVLLEASDLGDAVIETRRNDILQEVLDVELVPGKGNVAITVDNSILLFSAHDLSLKSHIKLNSPLCSITSFQSGSVFVGTMTGLLCGLDITGESEALTTRIISSEPITLFPSFAPPGKALALCKSRSYFVDGSTGDLCRVHIGQETISAAFVPSRNENELDYCFSVTSKGVVYMSRLSLAKFCAHDELFTQNFITSFPSSDETIVNLVESSSHLILLVKDSFPIFFNPKNKSAEIITSLGRVSAACALGSDFLIAHSPETGYCLLKQGRLVVWTKPADLEDTVQSIVLLSSGYFVAVTSTGIVKVYTLEEDAVPKLVTQRDLQLSAGGINKLFLATCNPNRIFLINCIRGIFTLAFAFNTILVTALQHCATGSIISASALLDDDTVVTGHSDGEIRIFKVPKSVADDEKSDVFFRMRSAPMDLCMTTIDLIASLHVESPVTSLIRSFDKNQRIVYVACANALGAIVPFVAGENPGFSFLAPESIPDRSLLHKLKGNWSW